MQFFSLKLNFKSGLKSHLLLPFIFVMSPCLIYFDRDSPNQLQYTVTLGGSSP
jgi:hypothetical protein